MSNPSIVTLQLAAAVTNGIAQAQTPSGAGALTLNGSLVTAGVTKMDVARRVAVASTGNDATVVFTITGTDRYGNKQTDTVAGLNNNSGYTVLDFLTVTRVTSSAGTAGQITVGTNGIASTDWVNDNWLVPNWSLTVFLSGPAGTNYALEGTLDDPAQTATNAPYGFSLNPASAVPPVPIPNPVINGVSGQAQAQYAPGNMIFAHRLTIVSGTGAVTMRSIQAGIGDT